MKSKLIYPHIEINLASEQTQVALVNAPTQRRVVASSAAGHMDKTMALAQELLPFTGPESDSYADDQGITFTSQEVSSEISFNPYLAELRAKVEHPSVNLNQTEGEVRQLLLANWQSDLLLAFRRAIHYHILTTALANAASVGNIENFVLIPGSDNDMIGWLASDLETLGYDLQVITPRNTSKDAGSGPM